MLDKSTTRNFTRLLCEPLPKAQVMSLSTYVAILHADSDRNVRLPPSSPTLAYDTSHSDAPGISSTNTETTVGSACAR